MKLTKEDLLVAAEAAEKWPFPNFKRWLTGYGDPSRKKQLVPGKA